MAVGEGAELCILVSCDLLFAPRALVRATEEILSARLPDFSPGKLILCATHIHTGPYLERDAESTLLRYPPEAEALTPPEEILRLTAERIADAAVTAYTVRRPAGITAAVSRMKTGYNRRVTYKDGSAAMYGSVRLPDFYGLEGPDGGNTNILYIRDESGELMGVMANVPCTAQVVEHKEYISSDYWGYTRAAVKNTLGDVPVVAVTASAGDLSPRDQVTTHLSEPSMTQEEGARWLGERIAGEIIRYADDAPITLCGPVRHLVREVLLPRWNPTRVQYENALCRMERYAAVMGENPFDNPDIPKLDFSDTEVMIARWEEKKQYMPAQIHALSFGNAVIITNPFECFVAYAGRITAALPETLVLTAQLTSGSMGYLATREAVRGGGYSAMMFNGQCSPDGGDLLVDESIKLVREVLSS